MFEVGASKRKKKMWFCGRLPCVYLKAEVSRKWLLTVKANWVNQNGDGENPWDLSRCRIEIWVEGKRIGKIKKQEVHPIEASVRHRDAKGVWKPIAAANAAGTVGTGICGKPS